MKAMLSLRQKIHESDWSNFLFYERIPQVYGAPECSCRSFIQCSVAGKWARLRGGRPCAGSATGVGPLLRRNIIFFNYIMTKLNKYYERAHYFTNP